MGVMGARTNLPGGKRQRSDQADAVFFTNALTTASSSLVMEVITPATTELAARHIRAARHDLTVEGHDMRFLCDRLDAVDQLLLFFLLQARNSPAFLFVDRCHAMQVAQQRVS